MIQSVCVLGRQPELGIAELESLYGAEIVHAVAAEVAGLSLPAEAIDFTRLGGSTRLATTLLEIPSTNWKIVEKELQKLVRSTAFVLPNSGKFHLGLSAIGFDVSPAKLNAVGLTLKKCIRARRSDGSVRLVPSTETVLSTAQVFHNHLTEENGAELLVLAAPSRTLIARTVAVQDIDGYTLRDRGRPKRDARVGMLPPKLAQIIVNLACGTIHTSQEQRAKSQETCILDPFCGTGVVLQEALLMGYNAYGTDLEPRMIDYTHANLDWLSEHYKIQTTNYKLAPGDATTHKWDLNIESPTADTLAIASEAYLGRPFTERPSREVLEQTVSQVNTIVKKFLENIHPQLPRGTRLCIAVPAWHLGRQSAYAKNPFRHLPVLDQLEQLGYKKTHYQHTLNTPLIYHREGQIVGRELVTLTCK
jgi:tRNA G10  N-methylase Trm11